MASLVVGFDGTDGARAALQEAIGLAQALGDDVVAVFAYDRIIRGGESHDLDRVVSERGHALLDEATRIGAEASVTVRGEYVEESPAQALVTAADGTDARLIVVGSYGERPLKGALVGSTPYKLLYLSERPVLVVRVAA